MAPAPELDCLPGPGDNNPPPWPASEPHRPEPPEINLAEPPGWRRRQSDDDL
jgi:hypothetical protein